MTRPLEIVVLAGTLLAGCGVPDNGPWMLPGADCLACHSAGGTAGNRAWTAAGTVFGADKVDVGLQGATVEITDSRGVVVKLLTNGAGNFYTAEPLSYPLSLALVHQGRRKEMPFKLEEGTRASCNSCHDSSQPLTAP